ncbi:hypothetical protein FisN_4Hh001 [Fistulifera solaris]|uniref:ShKT domain-containing protein n=1 Tax=Fistulifera solaris TaxID=1519565 RepID=A0A1Z5KPZ0_FISSO|nr:hypothetical protein FisN_4Hh001 [Fistulifera solaris]|eukprot:GAX28339.1 hypothetical protein FisN_4Hh001 [Fistulifera solaris]
MISLKQLLFVWLALAAVQAKKELLKDNHSKCVLWASQGECETNPGYMHQHCQTACLTTDNHSKCLEWAQRGECDINPKYMLHHCANSCNRVRSEAEL